MICAETDERAQYLAASRDLARLRQRQGILMPFPPPEEALAYPYTDIERRFIEYHRRRQIVGTPETVKPQLEALAAKLRGRRNRGADHHPRLPARKRSYALLAEAFGLAPLAGLRRLRRMAMGLLFAGLVLAGLCLALRLYMGRAAEDALQPGERVILAELRDPIPGNAFLACPPDYCAATAAPSPVFALSVDRLADRLGRDDRRRDAASFQVADEPAAHRLVLIQHTPLLRFPDIVTVEFVALAPDRSSLAIYSRARYGRGDFGTNRKRVLRWLDRLARIAG